ncbi:MULTISPECIES: hypothetical protein [unclassified Streptomyces]|uniref:hypothetical protein n=1 Tax=unclassified Streptomyces TaxID=2593676 RepID=UPI0035DF593C
MPMFPDAPSTKDYVRFTDPAMASFAAYRMFVYGDNVMSDQPGQVMSMALMRAVLINVTELDGYMVLDELSGSLMYKFPDIADVFIAHPDPDKETDGSRYLCAVCGQWKSEHRNPNGTACDGFHVRPVHGCADNPRCVHCDEPKLHHGRRYTVACDAFEAKPVPEYRTPAIAKDMAKLSQLLTEHGVPHVREYYDHGAFRIHADDGPWVLERILDVKQIPSMPALRFYTHFAGAGPLRVVGPMSAKQAVRYFAAKPASA